jgi:hypothetical protein
MALTRMVRLELESRGFKKLYEDHSKDWERDAERARAFIAVTTPDPGVDDIREFLLPIIRENPLHRNFVKSQRKPLMEPNWVGDFTDYVLDRVYQPKLRKIGG